MAKDKDHFSRTITLNVEGVVYRLDRNLAGQQQAPKSVSYRGNDPNDKNKIWAIVPPIGYNDVKQIAYWRLIYIDRGSASKVFTQQRIAADTNGKYKGEPEDLQKIVFNKKNVIIMRGNDHG